MGGGAISGQPATPARNLGVPGLPFLHVLILAVVQGLTEFLPVSSSGHLVLTWELFDSAGYET